MPNPLAAMDALLEADLLDLPAGTTHGSDFPTGKLDHVHVQVAWDGTPSDADNRETAAIRFTVWSPKGHVIEAQDVAGSLRARVLAWSSADVWRIDRGAGRLPGIDRDSGLPFCTFTVNVALTATAP